MAETMTKFAVYVSDDNGWLDGCPDHETVFFGRIPPTGNYVAAPDSDFGGHVEFDDKAEAEAFAECLNSSGDWTVKVPGHPSEGEEERPTYDVTEIE